MQKLDTHIPSLKKSHTNKDNKMMISAHTQVVLEEIDLDLKDFLRSLVGQHNDQDTRDLVSDFIANYLNMHQEVSAVSILCDESNNQPSAVENGIFSINCYFCIDGVDVRMIGSVVPSGNYVDVTNSITYTSNINGTRLTYDLDKDEITIHPAPVVDQIVYRNVYFIDLGDADLVAACEQVKQAMEQKESHEMPQSLATSLGY